MITFEEAKNLKRGEILIDSNNKRWRVNGQVRTWKLDPSRIVVPLKHGLYAYDRIEARHFDANGECHLLTKEEN